MHLIIRILYFSAISVNLSLYMAQSFGVDGRKGDDLPMFVKLDWWIMCGEMSVMVILGGVALHCVNLVSVVGLLGLSV